MKRDTANNEDLLQLHRYNRDEIRLLEIHLNHLYGRLIALEGHLGVRAESVEAAPPGWKYYKIKKVKK
jgi:hypothetical protein